MAHARETTPDHWQRFWTDGRPLHEVYSNQGRLVEQALAQGSLAGRRVLEVGAGTGRDTMELVRRGAKGYVLDYTFGSLRLMRIAIVGAGAIGGYLGARLAHAGEDVTLIARGANLAALKQHGLTLIEENGTELRTKNVKAVQRMAEADPQDSILLTVKAHQIAPIAADLRHLYDADTTVVTMQNGIPWWYFWKHGGTLEGTRLESVDPGGEIARHIDPARVIGSVVYPAAVLTKPGVVKVVEGNRFGLGEPSGEITERVKALSQGLTKAGFKAPVTSDIRGEIWLKLWGNLSFNPISALTHAGRRLHHAARSARRPDPPRRGQRRAARAARSAAHRHHLRRYHPRQLRFPGFARA